MSRKEERQEAFKVLYASEVNGSYDSEVESEFTDRLVDGTRKQGEKIDELLEANLDEWRLTRIYPVERVLLRLGVFELLYTDTEKPVVINEAVELAKKFGAEDSASFVNGILDNFGTGEKVS